MNRLLLLNYLPNRLKPRPILQSQPIWYELSAYGFILLAFYTLMNLTTVRFVVDGVSMEPTLQVGQLLVVSRMDYTFGEPERGDIVVLHVPNSPQDFIKRIIGLPEETIEFRDTQVYINGIVLDEAYLNEPCLIENCSDGFWQLGADEYFVMGDNRNHSADSRFFGPIPIGNIVGQAALRYYPLSEFTRIQ